MRGRRSTASTSLRSSRSTRPSSRATSRRTPGALRIDPRDASVAATKNGFTVTDGVEGRVADRLAPTDDLTLALADIDAPSELRVELEASSVEPAVTTDEANAAKAIAEKIATDVAIVAGKEFWKIPAATVRSFISFHVGADATYGPVVDAAKVNAALASVAKKVARTATNASFKVSGSRVTGVIAGRNGRALDVETTGSRVTDLLRTRAAGGANAPVEPAMTVTPPNLTTEEAQAAAPKMKKISTWTTYFFITERNGFGANIWIPALDINGTVVGPGETFDFWKAVGPVTRARGYERRRRDHQRPDRAAGRARRRDLLVLDDAVQRRAPGRLRDGRPAQPLLLHRPLPDRPRRDRVQERRRLDPDMTSRTTRRTRC